MAGKIVSVSEPRLHLDILRPEDVRQIHEATLEVIETVGVRFPSAQALDLWAAHGASVDRERMVVRAPGALIEKALQSAPPSYTLAARDPAQDLPLDGKNAYVGTDGCGVEVIDPASGQRRRSTLRDVAEIARLADAVPEVAFFWVPVSAQDRPAEVRGLHELAAAWANTTKHVQTETIYSAREARAAVEMAATVAGGREALRQRPLLSMMQCTIAPLSQDGGSVEAALIAAAAGLPVGFMTMASCASTGPATMAGTLVVGNAEVLSALALVLLTYPGTPVFYAAAQTAMDLRTGAYTGGGPEDFLFGAATNVLADFYNVPLSMGSFATGAKEPNWQAGLENSLSTLMAALSMSDMLLGVGLLHGSRIWSHEQMLLDCEIWSIVRQVMRGIVVDPETLALESIRAVGPGGHFLTQRHTRRHLGDLWVPTLLDRRPYEDWEKDRAGPRDWARGRAHQLLATHQPEPLDPALVAELDRIIAHA